MPSHNIDGSEAHYDSPDRRLLHFGHAHGSIVWGPPRRRASVRTWLAFAAGVAATLALALLLARSGA